MIYVYLIFPTLGQQTDCTPEDQDDKEEDSSCVDKPQDRVREGGHLPQPSPNFCSHIVLVDGGTGILSLPDYRNTLHLLLEWLLVFVREEVVMNHRYLLALLFICPQAHSGRRTEGAEKKADGGGGHIV